MASKNFSVTHYQTLTEKTWKMLIMTKKLTKAIINWQHTLKKIENCKFCQEKMPKFVLLNLEKQFITFRIYTVLTFEP